MITYQDGKFVIYTDDTAGKSLAELVLDTCYLYAARDEQMKARIEHLSNVVTGDYPDDGSEYKLEWKKPGGEK